MNLKKRIVLILGSCIVVLGLATGGVLLAANRLSQEERDSLEEAKKENLAPERINIEDVPSYSSDEEAEAAYNNFLADAISSGVKSLAAGISDCAIDITGLNNELPEVNVRITTNDSFDNASESDIQAYVAQALEISVENVKISYEK